MKSTPLHPIAAISHFSPLKSYFFRNRRPLALGLMSLLVVDFFQLLIPLVIKRAVDLLTSGEATLHMLLQLGMIIIALAIMIGVFRYVWRLLIFGNSRKVEEGLRNQLYEHLQSLSRSFYVRSKTGDLMARAINDINAVRMATGMGLVALTDGLVLGVAAVGFMISIDLRLTLLSLVPAPIIVILTRIVTRRMSAGFESVQNTFSDLTERVRETFAGLRIIKAYNQESWGTQRVEREGERYIAENLQLAKTLAFFFPMMALFTNVGLAVVIWFGGRLTIIGHITTGDFVAFTSYLNLLTWPMMAMGWVTNLLQRGSASMRRINRILNQPPDIADPAPGKGHDKIKGEIEFRHLHVRLSEQGRDTLEEINLRIPRGETVALVGRVGAGKTTLLQTLPRLLDASEGAVLVDGQDVRSIPLKELRKAIGFVTQEVYIFSDTVRNNILFGSAEASGEHLVRALKAADFLEDVEALEKGLDTLLGERGITLSGGQRQRLTIARALITDPPILILDDALSMVDTQTEEKILDQVLKMRRHKTNIIVSHRISTISRADRIFVLDNGHLAEEGHHKSLLVQKGLYALLYERQLLSQELEIGSS